MAKRWTLRIGIHTGPVVAGAMGQKKFTYYDLWGDAVNTASRMESHGLPARLFIFLKLPIKKLKANLIFECRGNIEVKGQGQMKTYILKTAGSSL